MTNTGNLEATIGGWYEKMNIPHLPKDGRKWLADNVWWLSLVGAILSMLGLVAVVPLFLAAIAIGTIATVTIASVPTYSGLFWLSALITVISYVGTTILLFMAVNPLKIKAKRGWKLLFLSYLINFGLAVVSNLVAWSVIGVVSALVGAVIAGYFLYEVRDYFGAHHKLAAKKARHTPASH